MITREQFQEKINSFGYTPEQVQLCLAYYDNNSKSESKPNVIDNYNAEDLWKTVNRWNGIKNSSKEKKPRTSNTAKQVEKLQAEVEKLINKLNEIIGETESTTLLSNIRALVSEVSNKAKTKEDEINNAKMEKYNQALALLNEYNKATGKNYKIVSE